MELLICWLSQVPNVIWGAVIASGLTIFGVFLTNKGYAKRQESLLFHEKLKFQSEQKLALKKDVFLNLASSFADALGIVPKIINLDFSDQDMNTALENHSGIVAKSYLVAKEKSVAEILDFSATTGEVFISLIKDRAVLLNHKREIEIYKSNIEAANSEKDRILSMMKEFNFQGRSDHETFDYLRESYESQQEYADESKKSMEEEKAILDPLFLSFARKCIEEHGRLLSLLPPMTIALRKELETDDESDVFVSALNSNISRMKNAFETLFD